MPVAAIPDQARIPALDGLRAISILLVVMSHLGLQRWIPGLFGVNVFFFVSGVLITRLLLAEAALQPIQLPRFYARRILRLYPALLTAILAGGVAYTALGGRISAPDALAAILYAANLREIAGGFISTVPGSAHPYGILWSLAVEEHFYIAFPPVVALLLRRPGALALGITIAIPVITLWRAHIAAGCTLHPCHDMRVLHGTDTRIDSILYGAALTAILASRASTALLHVLRNPLTVPAGLALIALSLLIRDPVFREVWRFACQGVGLFLAIGSLLFTPAMAPARRLLSIAPARILGNWSYSLYLWHWIILMIAVQFLPLNLQQAASEGGLPPGRWLPFAAPVIAASILMAALSHHLVERPMLAWRRRLGSHA